MNMTGWFLGMTPRPGLTLGYEGPCTAIHEVVDGFRGGGGTRIPLRAKPRTVTHDKAPRQPGEAISHTLHPDKADLVGGADCEANWKTKL